MLRLQPRHRKRDASECVSSPQQHVAPVSSTGAGAGTRTQMVF